MQSQAKSSRTSAIPVWLVLLGLAILINYIDRGNFSVAAPLLKDELHLNNTQIGVLITAFFWTYTLVMVVSGWIVDRFNVGWVLAAGFAIWSLATVATGLAQGIALLFVCRLALGAGESVAFPSCGKLIALNVPEHRRGIANAMLICGLGLGPAVGTFVCGTAMGRYGWRPVFIAVGLLSLIWIIPWLRFMPGRLVAQISSATGVSSLRMLRERNFWTASAGHFCSNYVLYFMIVWLPLYLVHERHLTMDQMARIASLFYLPLAASSPIAGWLADEAIRRGANANMVRKTTIGVGQVLVAIGVLACGAADPRVSFAGLVVAGIGCGAIGLNIYLFAQALAGPSMAGKWTGLQNCVGNISGIVVGPLTGWIVDRTGNFWLAFELCTAIALLGGVCWVFLVGPLCETVWTRAPELKPAATAVT
ncbi:MAG: MFS transporter [Candidatus Acidiferrales bacterium]